ncbi:MAG: carbohydrate kinase, partial [Bacteroidales bacterium]|nr:carbohydrate kinase [Bacteroidales bacterium]
SDDALLFGSISALWTDIRDEMQRCVRKAKKEGAFVLYDPNFRKNHASDLLDYKKLVVENMSEASVVKGSDEDFMNIFGTSSPDETWKVVSQYTDCMIYTTGANDVSVYTQSFKGVYGVPKITPVSTVGAGDNFNAGVLFSVYKEKIHASDILSLKESDWRNIITTAISFASHVCCSYDNYVSEDFGKKMRIIRCKWPYPLG